MNQEIIQALRENRLYYFEKACDKKHCDICQMTDPYLNSIIYKESKEIFNLCWDHLKEFTFICRTVNPSQNINNKQKDEFYNLQIVHREKEKEMNFFIKIRDRIIYYLLFVILALVCSIILF